MLSILKEILETLNPVLDKKCLLISDKMQAELTQEIISFQILDLIVKFFTLEAILKTLKNNSKENWTLAGIKLAVMLTQEVIQYQILDLIKTLKTLLPILISNKEFTEDGLFQDSQSQKLKKLKLKPNQLRHQSVLSSKTHKI